MSNNNGPIATVGVAYGAPMEEIDYQKVRPSEVDIVMVDPGPNRIQCIKLLREVSNELDNMFTISEAKDNLKPMSVVFHNVIYWKAKVIRDRFTEISAKVSFIVVEWY